MEKIYNFCHRYRRFLPSSTRTRTFLISFLLIGFISTLFAEPLPNKLRSAKPKENPELLKALANIHLANKLPACSISFSHLTVSGCYYYSGQSKATVSVEVSWSGLSDGNSITVTDGSTIRTITQRTTPTTSDPAVISPQVIAFEFNAGTSGTISASSSNAGGCSNSIGFTGPSACPPPSCSGTNIGGTVFYDFNNDGVKDVGETTTGLGGVTVTAISSDGTNYTTTTDSYGRYSLAVSGSTYPYRVEYSTLPTLYGQGTLKGSNGRTTVQFVNSGSCSVDLGVLNPVFYCQTDPDVIIPCYINGDAVAANSSLDALVKFKYSLRGPKNTGAMTELAQAKDVGSLWGVAYNKSLKKAYSSAVLHRHVGLSSHGLGAIFVTDITTNTTSLFYDASSIVGTYTSNSGRGLPTNTSSPSNDSQAFADVGKYGIGDLDISDDGSTLWFTDLTNKRLVKLPIPGGVPGTPTFFDISSAVSCSGGQVRPWGLKYYLDKVYVGVVCDASTSGNRNDLRANVLVIDGISPSATFSTIFDFPLTYPKGKADNPIAGRGWFPWEDNFATIYATQPSPPWIAYPQPIFADIEFDVDGSMVLGFLDRFGLQTGYQNRLQSGTSPLVNGIAAGDVLRAYFSNGTYVLENNAKVGPYTRSAGLNNKQGPGLGEFYFDDFTYHSENVQGGLAIRPGSGETAVVTMDPYETIVFANGIRYISNTTGEYVTGNNNTSSYVVYDGNSPGTLSKASGLGDVELACDLPTYLEIGNRIWVDLDKDGIQDPNEPPLPNIAVQLVNAANTPVGNTTTNSSGEYYFNSSNSSIAANTPYTIRVNTSASNLAPYSLTDNDKAGSNDLNDSDAILNGVNAEISVPALTSASVNHTYDIGFFCNFTVAASANPTSLCVGTTTQLSVNIAGATYSWGKSSSNAGSFTAAAQNPTVSNLNTTGNYSYTVTVTSGLCTATSSTSIDVIALTATASANPTAICLGETTTLNAGPVGQGYTYSWNGPGTITNTTSQAPVISGQTGGTKTFTVTVAQGGCTGTATVSITVNTSTPVNPSTVPVCTGATLNLSANIAQGSFSWAGPGGYSSINANPSIPNASTLNAGVYSVTVTNSVGCTGSNTISATVYTNPTASLGTTPVCAGQQNLVLTATTTNGTFGPVSNYSWVGPGAFSSFSASPLTRTPSAVGMSGAYTVTVRDGFSCTATASVVATVYAVPTVTLAAPPVCEPAALVISGTVTNGTSSTITTYSWVGPSAFTTTTLTPTLTRTPSLPAMSGNYSITITDANNCTAMGSVTALVKPFPSSSIATASPICEKETINLNLTVTPNTPGPITYSWTGPANFTSTIEDPSIPLATPNNSGTYSVTVNLNGCTATASASVRVKPLPRPLLGGATVCQGETINLQSSDGDLYSWSGPNGYTSTSQNPQRSNAQPDMSGTYTVTITKEACTATFTVTALVKPTPTVSASTTVSICTGQSFTLSATATPGSTYAWTGPADFNSTLQNPQRTNAQITMSGTYTVRVLLDGCPATATTSISVKQTPSPTVTGGPVCEGQTLQLNVSSADTYSWVGPFFTSTLQSPVRGNVTPAMGGAYTVSVTINGCTALATINVNVKSKPGVSAQISTTSVCVGNSFTLLAGSDPGDLQYNWLGPNGYTSNQKNPIVTNVTTAQQGIYMVAAQYNGCNNTATVSVSILPPPTGVSATGNNVCVGGFIQLNATGGSSYSWKGPNSFQNGTKSPQIGNANINNGGAYTVTVVGSNSCTATTSTSVIVYEPTPILVNSNSPLCIGTNLQLNATGGVSYTWTGPNGFSSTQQSPTKSNVTLDDIGAYTVKANMAAPNLCTNSNTVLVLINEQGATARSNSPVCTGGTISLSASSGGDSYSWTGPGFSSSSSNPIRTNASTDMDGVYTVTVKGNNGCSGIATVSVEIRITPTVSVTTSNNENNAVCTGGTIQLFAISTNASTYSWRGPNNFNSTAQNPMLVNANTQTGGIYTVTAIAQNGCTTTATIIVAVKPCLGSIGDYVWKDLDKDGFQDDNEVGVAGITVELYKTDAVGNPIGGVFATQTTNVNGYYNFADLTSGDYKVKFVIPSNMIDMVLTLRDQGSNDERDSDADPTSGFSQKVTIDVAGSGFVKDNPTIDAGLIQNYASLGNFVWKDLDKDGFQDDNEPGVAGVVVELYKANPDGSPNGLPISSKVTNSIGYYEFTQLASGEYVVKFIVPTNMNMPFTTKDQGPDDGKDSDVDPATGLSPKITLNANSTGVAKDNPTVDAGLINPPLGSIGDYVWKDLDKDGVQDDNEPGVPGVTVELYKTDANGNLQGGPIASQTTNSNGGYLFTGLESGDYKVKFTLPANMNMPFTLKDQGNNDGKDSDVDATGLSPKVTINVNGTGPNDKDNPTIDAGVINPETILGSIGDQVWKDANSNGRQDLTSEDGVKNITVELYKVENGVRGGTPIASTITDGNGYYLFTNLPTGDYQVRFVPSSFPADCNKLTAIDQGNDDTKDSDANVDTGFSPVVQLRPEQGGLLKDNPTIDAGLLPTALGSIGDYVWKDANKNGIQDQTELPVQGIVVELYNSDANGALLGAAIATQVTDANGKYLFDKLPSGNYRVKFIIPQTMIDMALTSKDQGEDDAKDSDADPVSGLSQVVNINVLGSGIAKDNPTIDAGLIQNYGSIGDYVWKDLDKDGFQDDNEPGVPGITVELYKTDANGTPQGAAIATKTTDANGKYLFDLLPSGDYKVKFIVPTNMNMPFTTKDTPTDDAKDSDADPNTGFSQKVTINASGTGIAKDNPTVDAGLINPTLGSIGDQVWKDANGNGRQDLTSENGIKGVTVELYKLDANGARPTTPLATQVTDDQGYYLFKDLVAGQYQVRFVPSSFPADCSKLTTPDSGNDDSKDSDANVDTGFTPVIPLNPDAGGILKDNPTIDAGLLPTVLGSIGDYVWKDTDKDGFQDPEEKGVPGVTVELYKSDANGNLQGAAIATQVTDANGYYLFDKLASGDYRVKFIVPTNMDMSLTTKDTPTDDAKDSDADPVSGLSQVVNINVLGSGIAKDNPTIDAGLIQNYGSIGDYVWKDLDKDGFQDDNEPGVPGITVELYKTDANGTPQGAAIATKTTDANGKYLFDLLPSGDYKVKFIVPTNMNMPFTTKDTPTDDAKDSDADPNTGFSQKVTINASGTGIAKDNPTVDAGLINPTLGSIGDQVWKDANGNGRQDLTSEEGVKGITVELYKLDANGARPTTPLATQVTDDQGYYLFKDLVAGQYQVRFVPSSFPADCSKLTAPDSGNDDSKDSDANVDTGFTPVIPMNPDAGGIFKDNPTIDAGLLPQFGSIGNYVWLDVDMDGQQDKEESPIKDVKVLLFNDKGEQLRSMMTNDKGEYLFDKLLSGKYYVKFMAPEGTEFTKKDTGADDTIDSDAADDGSTPVVMINAGLPSGDIGRDNPTIDAGIVPAYGSIGDFVWKDTNGNGIQDEGEKGVPNLKVYLLDGSGNKLDETTTDANGGYKFEHLLTGKYQIKIPTIPTDCDYTTPNQGINDNKDSDFGKDGLSPVITINTALPKGNIGRDNPSIDAGLVNQLGSIGDYVWFDKDNDGIQEANEAPIPNFKVELYNADTKALLATQFTNNEGKYLFDGLVTGKYQVRFVLPTEWLPWNPITFRYQGSDPAKDSNAEAPTAGWSEIVMIETIYPKGDIRRDNPTIDAGIDPFGSVGDFVWQDNNQNGIQDQGEPGVPGVKVVLLNADKTIEIATKYTDNTGYYRFDSLIDGRYYIKFVLPSNSSFTTANVGINDSVDSDAKEDGCSDYFDIVLTTNFLDVRRNNYTLDAGIIPCVKPDFTVATVQATCDGGLPKADAQLMIQGFQNGWRYDFSVGNTYVGGKSYATGTVIPPNGVIANNLANPATDQNYTVRVWSSAEGCYTDKTITLTKKDCGCVDPKCIPFIIIKK